MNTSGKGVYIFSCDNYENIKTASSRSKWAIRRPDTESQEKQFETKAAEMRVGSRGLFYSSQYKWFTVPFVVATSPGQDIIIETDEFVGGKFYLPFRIYPLGSPSDFLPIDAAKEHLPSLKYSDKDWQSILLFKPNLSFLESHTFDDDWECLLNKLGNRRFSLPETIG